MISAPKHGRRALCWSAALALLMPAVASAQVRHALFQPGQQQGQQASNNHWQGGNHNWVDAYGNSAVMPASFCGGGAGMMGGSCGCGTCGGGGGGGGGSCCMGGGGPYGPGGPFGNTCGMDPACNEYGVNLGVEQCGPHYFDFSAEALFWERADTGEPRVDFATDGVVAGPLGPGDAALSTDNVNFEIQPGMRLTGRYDLGALSLLEVSYSGLYEWSDTAQAPSASNELYSAFSQFGNDPFLGAGLTETDAASLHSIEYGSELHNAEISLRRYWVGFNPRVTGTFMGGFRYTNLQEDLLWHSETNIPGEMDYRVATFNHLAGFQAGGDMWVTVRQGCRIGAHGKAGIYNNHMKQRTNIDATTATAFELVRGDRVSFIGEGGVSMVLDVLPSWSLKAGYEVLFINTVALAPNNVNFNNNLFLGGNRTPVLIEESSVLYHGANLGLEYVW